MTQVFVLEPGLVAEWSIGNVPRQASFVRWVR